MKVSDFDYHLPPERIAQKPLPARDASRLLLLDRKTGAFEDRLFREFPELLRGNELIVLNNARVLPARLFGHREGIHAEHHSPENKEFLSAQIEVLLVRPLGDDTWECLVRPGRKVPAGERIMFGNGELVAKVEGRGDYGLRVLGFSAKGNFREIVERLGHVPLPPYIKRADDPSDRERYQTVFARQGTAVAAPTAGLHFTPAILERLRARGIEIVEITLDVGLGTFEPVRTEQIEQHKIHCETYEISEPAAEAIASAKKNSRPVLAVGTTVVRALEDAAEKSAARDANGPLIAPGKAEAEIFLLPGKPFRVVDQLLTNFHLPQSTLLALVCAFAGRQNVLAAYRHALDAEYRFYSYGDCMLLR
ncbi:MAG TPA: tRNA preQ1(34) S-adenosylmethionine ribosyltransferase-isomerase QueA [Candidatus Acidoferrales bacterium]|nr:tRNA preQ1(34) S-adenosylmethionine ribosyltransferase-isomerase QueA [Candidatus Acidoferrales bacterium]